MTTLTISIISVKKSTLNAKFTSPKNKLLKRILIALIAILFLISAIILPSVLWYKRRHRFVKERKSENFSTTTITELDSSESSELN